jgi:hypothetical protein
MKQIELPKFVDIKFYPGYSYSVGTKTNFAPGRYVALGEDGRAYAFVMHEGANTWKLID